jgi:two-component system phosphate regulon response regulator PhoB
MKHSSQQILAVDDDLDILTLLKYNLTREGYEVVSASDGSKAVELVHASRPDLILLDLMMPRLSGLDVTKTLRADPMTSKIPIIMLTAKGEESDIVIGLELGADDYIVKPFSIRVLLARVKAVLRRSESIDAHSTSQSLNIEGISIVPDRFEVHVDGVAINLTATEFRLLHLLSIRRGRVITRMQIVDETRGEDYAVTDRSVDVHVTSLRKKLGEHGSLIETVRGVGYRMKG